MLTECPYCDARVRAEEKAAYETERADEHVKLVILECPGCSASFLGVCDLCQVGPNEFDWTEATVLWPEPDRLDIGIPQDIRDDLQAAKTCFRVRTYSASVVMSGRAIERLCRAKTKEKTLGKGLEALRAAGEIDDMLYKWGTALRKERNIGAHATEDDVHREDAADVLDFAIAICEYVFVLAAKYENYKKRKGIA